MKKNSLLAFFLAFLPGFGHIYINRKRGVVYALGFIAPIIFGIGLSIISHSSEPLVLIILSGIVWVINIIDIIITLLKSEPNKTQSKETEDVSTPINSAENERFYTIILSFVPGLGHFQLGLMYRGLTFMLTFFGLAALIFFVAILTSNGGFIVFLSALPVIWIYNFFDSMKQLNLKQNGEELIDRSVLEEFDSYRENGKKSKLFATILSVFPGAGHMYLGLQQRGLQLMAAFLFSIYFLNLLNLSVFLFLIPIIWFFSFFDALQKISKNEEEKHEDVPIISYFINHQKWLGYILIALGTVYLFDSVLLPVFNQSFQQLFGIDFSFWYRRYFQTTVVSILLIGGGLKLVLGSKDRKGVKTK